MKNKPTDVSFSKALSERKKLKQKLSLREIDQETYDRLSEPYSKIINQKLNKLKNHD